MIKKPNKRCGFSDSLVWIERRLISILTTIYYVSISWLTAYKLDMKFTTNGCKATYFKLCILDRLKPNFYNGIIGELFHLVFK